MYPFGPITVNNVTLADLGRKWTKPAGVDPDPLDSAIEFGGPLTHEHLDLFDERLTLLRWIDDMEGGALFIDHGIVLLRHIYAIVDNTTYDDALSKRLYSSVTATIRLAAWLQFDATYNASAQKLFAAALRTSMFTRDLVEGANVLGFMSKQAADCGHTWLAVFLAEDAEDKSKHVATPLVRSMLAANKAYAYAKAGDSKACGRALNNAEHWMDRANPGIQEPEWLYYFDEYFLAGLTAGCWVSLGQPRPARRLIETFLKERPAYFVRERAIRRIDSAMAHLMSKDLEPACDDLRAAANLCYHFESPRTNELVRAARKAMARYDNDPRVQDLDRFVDPLPRPDSIPRSEA